MRVLLDEAVVETRATVRPPLGMMVEVPTAALAIEQFEADFYSIGSNDLIQYLAAASRDEPELAALDETLAGAVAALEGHGAARSPHRTRGQPLRGLAGDPAAIPAVLDCGLRKLSVAPAALASVKAAIASYGRNA